MFWVLAPLIAAILALFCVTAAGALRRGVVETRTGPVLRAETPLSFHLRIAWMALFRLFSSGSRGAMPPKAGTHPASISTPTSRCCSRSSPRLFWCRAFASAAPTCWNRRRPKPRPFAIGSASSSSPTSPRSSSAAPFFKAERLPVAPAERRPETPPPPRPNGAGPPCTRPAPSPPAAPSCHAPNGGWSRCSG